ncbi:MAG: O-methyltransferase [Bacteroidetes bacterium]|nr:O-methyltransferase [Bacteroidota bacterium]MBK9671073.1 O-methyltransferase [Bacteroidota bacterium]MBK9798218.1 O-methyltransferase [Bacteroidota bacterium]MBP6414106.1 O-methyltransferase [Bacteroidia bacterium]
MEFIDEQLAAYVEEHTQSESKLLKKINRDTHVNVLMPRMLSGHLQGQVLRMLSLMIQPAKVLEIGTYTGYSALCLAEGLTETGKLITIDINAELEERVRGYFAESSVKQKIEYRIGNALEIIPTLNESFDLVFIDADKSNYSNYFDLCIDKVRKGGYLIADNVLWSGKILMPLEKMDKDTLLIHKFNKKIQEDKRVENVLFPIRDGLMVMRKL